MKLIDFSFFEPFEILKNKMGAAHSGNYSLDFKPNYITPLEWKELTVDGKEIDIDEIKIHEDGTLIWKNTRVLPLREDQSSQKWLLQGERI